MHTIAISHDHSCKRPKPHVMVVIATDIIGGPGKGLFQFLKFADHNRFDYCLCNYAPKNLDQIRHRNVRHDFLEKATEMGIQIDWLYQGSRFDPSLVVQAGRIIRKHKINIIQTHGYKSNLLGCLVKRLFGISWIAFAHGYTSENKKMDLYKQLDLFSYRFADRAVVVSDPLMQLIRRHRTPRERIVKLPNAVDLDELTCSVDLASLRHSIGVDQNHKVIGVIGRLSPEKGQIVFLKAFRQMTIRFDNLKALIIGDGQERDQLESYCRRNNLQSQIVFTGHVTNIGNYYRLLDLLALPSFSEGLPNVLLEAMALGIPAVATDVGAVKEVLDGLHMNIVPAGNPKILAEKMTHLLSDAAAYQATRDLGKTIIDSRFSPVDRARTLVDLYDQVLADRNQFDDARL